MVVINEDYFQPAIDDIIESGRVGMCGNCFVFKVSLNLIHFLVFFFSQLPSAQPNEK